MRTIIAGSRGADSYNAVLLAIKKSGIEITEVVSGGARGVDRLGEQFAKLNDIPIKQFIPDWDGLGKRAGYARNVDMSNYADALIAIWDGKSRGTQHMIDIMKKTDKPYYVLVVDEDSDYNC